MSSWRAKAQKFFSRFFFPFFFFCFREPIPSKHREKGKEEHLNQSATEGIGHEQHAKRSAPRLRPSLREGVNVARVQPTQQQNTQRACHPGLTSSNRG